MQFKVPQFIEIESKIIGPLTFKQAVYVGGAAGISYVLLKILPSFVAFPFVIVVLLFGWALAFYPKQKFGKPFIEIAEAAFRYSTKGKLYTWRRNEQKTITATEEKESSTSPLLSIPKVSGGKLRDASKELEVGSRTTN